MRHPTDGTLRRLLDEPAGVADVDREHVAHCQECLAGLAAAREDAAATGAALGTDAAADVDAGWHRLSSTLAAQSRPVASGYRAPSRWRAALRSPVVAAAGVLALLTGVSAAAAADWLPIFRTEQIAAAPVTQADLVQLPDLSGFGDVEVVQEPEVRPVPDAATAAEITGLAVPEVAELPRGVTGEPSYQVGDQASAVFTFSAEKAARTAEADGGTVPPPPPGLDGSQFRLEAGPGVAQVWTEARGVPALVVGRAVAPTAYSSGVPFETARDYLLSLPGLPEDLAAQLRGFTGEATILPLPVPADHVSTSEADVRGVPATVVTSRDGALAGVVWVEDGTLTAVAGSLTTEEVLTVARGLQE